MRRIQYDITLLSHFNLMDYSMLFVAAFNPNYVKEFPQKFEKGQKKGEWKLTQEEQKKLLIKDMKFSSDKKKTKIKN